MSKIIYKIDGDMVTEVHETINKQCSVDDFLYNCKLQSEVDTGILPRSCLAIRYKGKTKITVLEMTPRQVPVKYRNTRADRQLYELNISVPFVQFYQVTYTDGDAMGQIYLSCTKKRITSMEDPVFVLPVLNQYEDGHGHVCTGSISMDVKLSMIEKIERFISAFFAAEFNDDLSIRSPKAFACTENKIKLDGMQAWSAQTTKNKMFGLASKVEYTPHNQKNFGALLNYIYDRNKG